MHSFLLPYIDIRISSLRQFDWTILKALLPFLSDLENSIKKLMRTKPITVQMGNTGYFSERIRMLGWGTLALRKQIPLF